jgi:hypothetical protein
MEKSIVTRNAVALGLALSIGIGGAAAAATPVHEISPVVALKLNVGKRWETDAALRKAMSEIRDALAADGDALSAGMMNNSKYEALAKKIDAQTAYVVVNCKLPPEADAQLHVVLAQIMQGSVAMKGQDPNLSRRTGAERVVAALDAYSRFFEHPGW